MSNSIWRHAALPAALAAAFVFLKGLTPTASATGVPMGGFLPLVGIGLTEEFDRDFNFFPFPAIDPTGIPMLGPNGTAHYELALIDTGASLSLLNYQSDIAFNMAGPYDDQKDGGYHGTESIPLGGATGQIVAQVNDPLGLYAGGVQYRTAGPTFAMNNVALRGQTNTSTATLPEESNLPNVLGLPFASQYATYIRSDQPQLFQVNGQTVRTPAIDFLPLGSGGQGIARRAPLSLNPGSTFFQPPAYLPNIVNFDLDNPQENPVFPTIQQGGLFLNVNVGNEGAQLSNLQFFFDTGADVSVISELTALQLGIDLVLDEPDFTAAIIGSGGEESNIPGYYIDSLTIQAIGGSVTLTNVPVIVRDIPSPADIGNVVPGLIGTNLLTGRNLVIDPNPAVGGTGGSPSLYISDPVTRQVSWTSTAASGTWANTAAWSSFTTPELLDVVNLRRTAGGNQEVQLFGNGVAQEVNISGASSNQQMKLRVQPNSALVTFSGVNVEQNGVLQLEGGIVDAQFVEVIGGRLTGYGAIATGSGPVPGQVEIINGTFAPGLGAGSLVIEGRLALSKSSVLEIEIGGPMAGTQFDQIVVEGSAALNGILNVSLLNPGGGAFIPAIGSQFVFLVTSDGVDGQFSTVNLPVLPVDRRWNLAYVDNAAVLLVTLPGDFNADGIVNSADLVVYKAGYGTKYDGRDLLDWQMNLGSGGLAAVPEPGAAMLASCAGLLAFAQRRRRK